MKRTKRDRERIREDGKNGGIDEGDECKWTEY